MTEASTRERVEMSGEKPREFVITQAVGSKPGWVWVANEENDGKGRVYEVRMRFGKEVERTRITKIYKKLGAKKVRDEIDPVLGDLLFNEREHGALTEPMVREIIERVKRRLRGPRPGGPRGRGGRPGGGRPGGRPGGGGGGGGGGRPGGNRPPRGPRPHGGPAREGSGGEGGGGGGGQPS